MHHIKRCCFNKSPYKITQNNRHCKNANCNIREQLIFPVFDPLFGYFYKRVLMGKPAAEVALVWNITTTSVNAIISAVVAVIIYMALRPALKKANLFLTLK